MSRAVLSIGSNQGDPQVYLQSAVKAFSPYLVGVSPVFRTPAWGPVDQPEFLNAVLIVADSEADAHDWLARGHACEQAAGRTRELRWGPRTLDVDIVSVNAGSGDATDEVISDDPVLTLPHPRAAERAFVLVPWWALDPEAFLVGYGSVLDLMQALPPSEVEAVRLVPGIELLP
ncbi:2-amino-4-hydroxy-6-hydroxymethyldihydropteridine diphosphokinase [Jatrophihabitans sp. DSM 45814]